MKNLESTDRSLPRRRARTHPGNVRGGCALLAVLLGLAATVPASAADTLRLSAADAASLAISGGPDAVGRRVELERARAGRAGIGGFFPAFPEVELGGTTDAPFLAHGERELELGVSQEIEIGGQYFLRRDAADASVAQAELELRSAELELRADARALHARLLAAQEREGLVASLVSFGRRLDTIAERQYSVGEISELDRNAVRISSTVAEMELLAARREIAETRAELRRFLGVPPASVVMAVPDGSGVAQAAIAAILDSVERVEQGLASGDESILRGRPDWQALERARARYRAEEALAGRRLLPTLRLGVGLLDETRVLASSHEDTGHTHLPTLSSDRFLTFHLGFQLPLPFSGAYDLGEGDRLAAVAGMAGVEAEQRSLAARITGDLARAAARLRGAAGALELYNSRIAPLVERNLELLERGYAAGELTATQVVAQQEGLLRGSQAVVDARREFAEALAEFERALGR